MSLTNEELQSYLAFCRLDDEVVEHVANMPTLNGASWAGMIGVANMRHSGVGVPPPAPSVEHIRGPSGGLPPPPLLATTW